MSVRKPALVRLSRQNRQTGQRVNTTKSTWLHSAIIERFLTMRNGVMSVLRKIGEAASPPRLHAPPGPQRSSNHFAKAGIVMQ